MVKIISGYWKSSTSNISFYWANVLINQWVIYRQNNTEIAIDFVNGIYNTVLLNTTLKDINGDHLAYKNILLFVNGVNVGNTTIDIIEL